VVVLQKHFYWPKIQQDVSKYIRSCIVCAIAKSKIMNQGLYTPLPIPKNPWESISMDYMTGFLSTKHENDYMFVVLDRFSNMDILTTCKKNVTAADTTKLFFERVFGFTLGYHRPSSPTETIGSSTPFGRVSGLCWTPSSQNPLLSTPKPMAKPRSSINDCAHPVHVQL
jgi:hypothetical protein